MNSTEIQANIDQAKVRLAAQSSALDAKCLDFARHLAGPVHQFLDVEIKRLIARDAARVNRGEVDVDKLGKAYDALIDRLPTICVDAVGERSTWPHYRDRHKFPTAKATDWARACFLVAVRPLGDVLADFGFAERAIVSRRRLSHREWLWDQGSNSFRYEEGFPKGIHLPTVESLEVLLSRYDDEFSKLRELEKALERAQATERWESRNGPSAR